MHTNMVYVAVIFVSLQIHLIYYVCVFFYLEKQQQNMEPVNLIIDTNVEHDDILKIFLEQWTSMERSFAFGGLSDVRLRKRWLDAR